MCECVGRPGGTSEGGEEEGTGAEEERGGA